MKLKKNVVYAVVAMVGSVLITSSVWAGSVQQHRWEGVAIGVGSAIVAGMLLNHHMSVHPSPPPPRYHAMMGHRPHYVPMNRYPSHHTGYKHHWRYNGHRKYDQPGPQHGQPQGKFSRPAHKNPPGNDFGRNGGVNRGRR